MSSSSMCREIVVCQITPLIQLVYLVQEFLVYATFHQHIAQEVDTNLSWIAPITCGRSFSP
ncbi:hypothetical protein KY285_011573 [Solanum tuberosum]|nr:hypothetical protein KY285_011573 [Solanum tuberosum]